MVVKNECLSDLCQDISDSHASLKLISKMVSYAKLESHVRSLTHSADHRVVSVAVSPSSPPGQCGWFQSGLLGGKADGNTWQRPATTTLASAGRSPEGQKGEETDKRTK